MAKRPNTSIKNDNFSDSLSKNGMDCLAFSPISSTLVRLQRQAQDSLPLPGDYILAVRRQHNLKCRCNFCQRRSVREERRDDFGIVDNAISSSEDESACQPAIRERRSATPNAPSIGEIHVGRYEPIDPVAFVIVHRYQQSGSCLPGEEIAGVWLDPNGPQLRLSLALRILFDYLARHRWLAQSATQIESAIRQDPFCIRHAANSGARKLKRRITRSAIKVYAARIRQAIQLAFDQAGIEIKATDVLLSESTLSTEVGYKLRATVRWVHVG